jgi:hypothetical protein
MAGFISFESELDSGVRADDFLDRNVCSITFCGWTAMVGICFSLESGLVDQDLTTASVLAVLLVIILIVATCVLAQGYSDRLVWAWKTGPFK